MYGTCPQVCKNTKGSYDCECAPGYRKVGNGKMCEAAGKNRWVFFGAEKTSQLLKYIFGLIYSLLSHLSVKNRFINDLMVGLVSRHAFSIPRFETARMLLYLITVVSIAVKN